MSTAGTTTPRQATLAFAGLLVVAATWGAGFPLTKQLLGRVPAVDFLAQRYMLAGLLLLVLFFPAARRLPGPMLRRGIGLGVLFGIAQLIQTQGLGHTTASASGFITGMYVVLTPVCAALLLKTPISGAWWGGAGIAAAGLAVISLNGFSLGFGESLSLFSALLFALHIVGLGRWSSGRDALGLAVVQMAAAGAVCLLVALPSGITIISEPADWATVIFMAVVSGAIAMVMQSWAQAHLPAPRAAIVMCTEPVWAAGLAIAFFQEVLTWRILVGGSLILLAMLVVEMHPGRLDEAPRMNS